MLQADQIKTGAAVGDLMRLVDADPPSGVPGLPAGVDLRLCANGTYAKQFGWAYPVESGLYFVETTYTRWSAFLWPGRNFYGRDPVRFKLLIENDVAGKVFDLRIYDSTNSEVICEALAIPSSATMAILTLATGIANVTATEAVWEIQLRRPTGQQNAVDAMIAYFQADLV